VNIKRENTINRIEMEELDLHTKILTKETSCDMCDVYPSERKFSHIFHMPNGDLPCEFLRVYVILTSDQIGEKPFHCDVCPMKCYSNSDLQKHIRIHTGDKPYKCFECGKEFTQNFHLTTHIRNKHEHINVM
jgi:uncharacterized Zn-finger protein